MLHRVVGVLITLVLSTCSTVGDIIVTLNSDNSLRSQITFELATDITRYSAFVDDLDVRDLFLHLQDIKNVSRNIHQLEQQN